MSKSASLEVGYGSRSGETALAVAEFGAGEFACGSWMGGG